MVALRNFVAIGARRMLAAGPPGSFMDFTVQDEPMARFSGLSIALAPSLIATIAQAEPTRKRPKPVRHGYGFLPGYRQPAEQ
jgi:hypothetical protein